MLPLPCRRLCCAALLLLAPTFASGQQPKSGLQAFTGKPEAIYKSGEKVTIKVTSAEDGEATYRITEDGHRVISEGKLKLTKGGAAAVEASLPHPGFLLLQVQMNKKVAFAAAAIDPTKIQPTARMPK